MQRRPLNPMIVFGALVALVGAVFAVFIANLTQADYEGHDSVYTVQLVVALVGLLPAGCLVYAAAAGRRNLAVTALVTGVLAYGSWALLNNLAVHGSVFGS